MNERGSNRREQPGVGVPAPFILAGALALIVLGVFATYAAAHLGHRIAGLRPAPHGLKATIRGLMSGDVAWPVASTVVLVAMALALITVVVGPVVFIRRRRKGRGRADWAAKVMGRGEEIASLHEKKAAQTAARLGVTSAPGVSLGSTVAPPRTRLYGDWEMTGVLFAGPRVGKSTCYGVGPILDAPGGVLVTSNKRDLVDATRDPRTKAGSQVWVFDPQRVAREEPRFWWDPLSYIRAGLEDDDCEVRAETMAAHFATNAKADASKEDSFFEPKGERLLRNFLLAAALDNRPITDVHTWSGRPEDDTAVTILNRHGYGLQAESVESEILSTEKQRSGVFGTTAKMVSCLETRQLLRWITDPGGGVPHFDPAEFVRNAGTLYSLSKEGAGSSGTIVTCLTNAVCAAAEEQGIREGGRLKTPIVGILDEAANVCRWRDLPKLYSHYGSRGIILMTILQSWTQGVGVWGEAGLGALWSASTHKIYAGGIANRGFLEDLSALIGTYDRETRSISSRTGGSWGDVNVQTQIQRESIMEVADLAALPKGRAVVLSSGNRPTLVETLPWMSGPHADAVRASIKAHDPVAEETLRQASDELAKVQANLAHLDGSGTAAG